MDFTVSNMQVERWGGIDALSERFDLFKAEFESDTEYPDSVFLFAHIKYPELETEQFRIWAAVINIFTKQLQQDKDPDIRRIANIAENRNLSVGQKYAHKMNAAI